MIHPCSKEDDADMLILYEPGPRNWSRSADVDVGRPSFCHYLLILWARKAQALLKTETIESRGQRLLSAAAAG